jgi:molybdopterin molybdotransferase
MIDVDQADQIVQREARPLPSVEVPLGAALHRTLAEPVHCDRDCPAFNRSLMDGYAVRSIDLANPPVELRVVGHLAANDEATGTVGAGEAMQINTGAPLPPGADAVIPVEDTQRLPDAATVTIRAPTSVGRFIAAQGSYSRCGQVALARGTSMTPLEIGVAATCGACKVPVHRQPRVGVLITGDELVPIDEVPTGAGIRNSNQWLLESLIQDAHALAIVYGVAPDDRDDLRVRIAEGLESCDVLCLSGGVSMGAFDLVPDALADCGVTFHIRKMAIQPGKPVIFATTPKGTLVFALPGNPIGVFVGFTLLVRPALAALEGRPGEAPQAIRAHLLTPVEATAERRRYHPARAFVNEHGEWAAEALSWHGSADPFGAVTANALITRPPHSAPAQVGEAVSILLLGPPRCQARRGDA